MDEKEENIAYEILKALDGLELPQADKIELHHVQQLSFLLPAHYTDRQLE